MGFADLTRWKDGWSEHVRDAALEIFRNACCKDGHPNADLLQQLLCAIEIFNADAASDEQLAGSLLCGQKLDDVVYNPSWLPHIIMVHRDKPHAARRLIQRGWKADGYLKKVARVKNHNYSTGSFLFS